LVADQGRVKGMVDDGDLVMQDVAIGASL